MMMDFIGTQLETNIITIESEAFNEEIFPGVPGVLYNGTASHSRFWHKSTGIQLGEFSEIQVTRSINGSEVYLDGHTELVIVSTIPIIPEFQSWAILPLFLVATFVIIILKKC